MPGNFVDASVHDEKLRDIKLVFMTALCSKSGVANPVSFVVTEGEGIGLRSHSYQSVVAGDSQKRESSFHPRDYDIAHCPSQARVLSRQLIGYQRGGWLEFNGAFNTI